MKNSIAIAAAALTGSAIAQSLGSAVVVNSCSYPVYLQNTPSAGGGFSEIDQTLQPGGSYSQVYTELSNGNGWSLKLSPTEGDFGGGILQYEYTWQGWTGALGGILWFDLSEVNGNPFNGDWLITADGDCQPKQSAYLFSTDDAVGEQSCPAASSITVTICANGNGSSGSGSSSASSASPLSEPSLSVSIPSIPLAAATTASTTTSAAVAAASQPTPPATLPTGSPLNSNELKQVADKAGKHHKETPTTFATKTTIAVNRGGVTVTDVATEIVTAFVTAVPHKRHQHHARHPHHHHH